MPSLPQDGDGPVFNEPWEAKAFAVVLDLYDRGGFTWPEWVDCLSAEIAAAKDRGDPDLGDGYYLHWLTALEKLVDAKGLASTGELAACKADWAEADRKRAFGEAPVLERSAASGPGGPGDG
jgi:nitrile hydratase accessory protein